MAHIQNLSDDCVLIAGAGPVGLLTATVLAFYGVKSVMFERNESTTRWPKMDLTNVRSMEFLRKLGLADSLRMQGVPSTVPYNVIFTPGLSRDESYTQWSLPSVEQYRQNIKDLNDGSQPLEPYQRLSQAVFEAWMRKQCDANPLIDVRFGWKLEDVHESAEGVEAKVTEKSTNVEHLFKCNYMIACDGASSKARRSLEIPLDGGPVPTAFLLVHFRSKDLARIHRHGRFWHLFVLQPNKFVGAVISQDEKEIFTIHYALAPGVDESTIGSEEAVYSVLGGEGGPYPIKIDQVLVRSTYRPSIAVARSFASPNLRIFLAGDAAHQNIPTGGYGMNTGLGDAFDIGWKLAAVINRFGSPGLLRSYDVERRPVSIMNVERSGFHMDVHLKAIEILGGSSDGSQTQTSDKARETREKVHSHYQLNNGENTDLGIEMGYRYVSPVCMPDENDLPSTWTPHHYLPTTIPGSRPPHVFLQDGSALFDKLGAAYSLVEFRADGDDDIGSRLLVEAAKVLGIPLTHVVLSGENHAARLWEKPLVLVRPDTHVAWRGSRVTHWSQGYAILETVTGFHWSEQQSRQESTTGREPVQAGSQPYSQELPKKFTSTEKNTTQVKEYVLDGMGEFQK